MFIKPLIEDIKNLLKSRDVIILLLLGPIGLTLYFGGCYTNTYVNDIPIAILDEDHSALSRTVTRCFEENDRFSVKQTVNNTEELKRLVDSKEVGMGVCIPSGFSSDISKGVASDVLIIVDGTNLVVGNTGYAAAANTIQTVAAGASIKRLEAGGVVGPVAANMANPFNINDRMLYNPKLAYMDYMLLGYIAVFFQQVMLQGVGILMIRDGYRIAGETPFGMLKETAAKVFACSFYALTSVGGALLVATKLFHVPIQGNVLLAMFYCQLYAFAISAPAIIIASIVKDKLKFIQIGYTLSLPTFISCGYIWPLDQTPQALVVLTKAFWPLAYFARPFNDLLYKGVFPTEGLIGLTIFTAIWLPISLYIFKRRYSCEEDKYVQVASTVNP